MCTFLFWMLHYGIWNTCILGFVKLVYYLMGPLQGVHMFLMSANHFLDKQNPMQGTHEVCRNPIDWSNTMIHKSIFCENLVWIISNARVSSRTDNNENANVFWCFQIKHQHFYVNSTQGHYPRAMVRKVTAIHWPYSPGGSSGGDIVFKQSNIESRNHAIIHLCPISRDDILVD